MNLIVTDNVTEEDIGVLFEGLKEYNVLRRGPWDKKTIGVFIEDENGNKMAGLTGETNGNWLTIQYLWVSEELRHQGVGSKIIEAAEEEAIKRGAKYAFVDTFDFQAPEFYKKRGYTEVFRLSEYPLTGSRIYYTKKLSV